MIMIKSIRDLDVYNKAVLLRADLNVPIKDGIITDDTRIDKVLPTIIHLRDRGAKVIILSHLGRPDAQPDHINLEFPLWGRENLSLAPIARKLKGILPGPHCPQFVEDCIGQKASEAVASMRSGDILLLENLRFHKGETQNDEAFARELAKLGEIYVNDAFSCSHRAHASLVKLPRLLPAAAGFLLLEEIEQINSMLDAAQKPMMAIVGGAKISTKIDLLNKLAGSADYLVIGGILANCFLKCRGSNIGASLCYSDKLDVALNILQIAEDNSCQIILPMDAIVSVNGMGTRYAARSLADIQARDLICDIGPRSRAKINQIMENCRTVLWNGPLGVWDLPCCVGTGAVAHQIALLTSEGKIKSLVGGGDSMEIINKFKIKEEYTHLSTGGGAFLKYIENRSLVGLEALES